MMNPNLLGRPANVQEQSNFPTQLMPSGQQQQQQEQQPQQQQQHYNAVNWQNVSPPMEATATIGNNMPSQMPRQCATTSTSGNMMLNGNYQQQLSQSMSAMSVALMEQPPMLQSPQQQQKQMQSVPAGNLNNIGSRNATTPPPPIANTNNTPMQPHLSKPSPPLPQNLSTNITNNYATLPNGPLNRPQTVGNSTITATSQSGHNASIPNQATANNSNNASVMHSTSVPHKPVQVNQFMPPASTEYDQAQKNYSASKQTQHSSGERYTPQLQSMPNKAGQNPMMPNISEPPSANSYMQSSGVPPLTGQQQQFSGYAMQTQHQMPGYPPQIPLQQQTPNYAHQTPTQQQNPGYPPQLQSQLQTPGFPPQPQSQQLIPGCPPHTQQQMSAYPTQTQSQQMPGYGPLVQQQIAGYPSQSQQQICGYPPQQQQQMAPPPMPGTYPAQHNQQLLNRPNYNVAGASGMYQQPQQPYQQSRRLDPDQMPNPIQVVIENQRNAGGAFVTNQPGLLPPLVTTKYIVQDQGNSSPRYMRSSLYCIPATADLLKSTALPFALIVSPFAVIAEGENEPPIVDFGTLGPIRCNRCKAYMSPNMQFVDAGRMFQCLMCKVNTEVPMEYFQHLDHTGQRVDKYKRPELVLGTYEFLATNDYCRDNVTPEIPAFIFIIDVSYNNIKSGLVHLLCSQIKRILKHLPVDQGQEKSKMRVGFITYNSSVHFYNIKSSLAQPQMMVVGDVQDMFMPLLDGFLCQPEESENVIDVLMEQIPKMFVDTKETEITLYPAIQAGLEALKASKCAGKLFVFNSSLPVADAPGKLKNRDDRKLLGTEKEKSVLTPQSQVYYQLGEECVQHGCSVDMFLFNNAYIDIATIGQVSKLTGGEIYKYTYFQADIDGKRVIEDIIKNISRPIAFDAVMRVRTSTGIRPTDFYGHHYMSNTTDIELASVDCNKSIAIEIKHDDKLPSEENVYLQVALLYTSCSGQRRLRIFNLALLATTTIAEVFKRCDLDSMMLFFAKQACTKLMELTPKTVKDNLIHRSAQILACYRKHCTSPTSAGQLILPECLKLLPLYVSCLLKNDAISGGSDMTLDDRSYVIHFVLAMDLNVSVSHIYPRLIPIHNLDASDSNDDSIPMSIRCTNEKMCEDAAYILENGVHFFIWLGQSLPATFIQSLFGVQCTQQVNAERFLITGDNPLAHKVLQCIEKIMKSRTRYMKVTCVRQNDKLEAVFRHFLIEDRGTNGTASYVDFLCHMHKEIKDLLS